MHSVCRCSLPVWRRSFLKKGTPRDLFWPRPGSAPGMIWPKNNNTCKGPWVLHPYQVSSKSIKRFWRRSWKCESLQTDDGRTDDGRCAMTIAHSSLRLRWAKYRIQRCAPPAVNEKYRTLQRASNNSRQTWKFSDQKGGCNPFPKPGTYILKGHASLPKSPLIGGLFTCHKNPSAPSALSRPLNVLRRLMRFSSKARGSFKAGITPPGHICVLISLVWHRGGQWVAIWWDDR